MVLQNLHFSYYNYIQYSNLDNFKPQYLLSLSSGMSCNEPPKALPSDEFGYILPNCTITMEFYIMIAADLGQ